MLSWQAKRAGLLVVVASSMLGCSGASSSVQGTTAFDGTYNGTYTGADSGTVLLTITDGNVQVTATSTFFKSTFTGSGQVLADGQLVGTGGGGGGSTTTSTGVTITYNGVSISFAGTISGGAASGSWSSSNSAGGTWQAHD